MVKNAIMLISILNAVVFCAVSAVAGYFGYDVISIAASRIAMVMVGVLVVTVIFSAISDLLWCFTGQDRRNRV